MEVLLYSYYFIVATIKYYFIRYVNNFTNSVNLIILCIYYFKISVCGDFFFDR